MSYVYEGGAQCQVSDPAAQRLQRRVRGAGPVLRHLVVQEAVVDPLHLLRHHHQASYGLLQGAQGGLHTHTHHNLHN